MTVTSGFFLIEQAPSDLLVPSAKESAQYGNTGCGVFKWGIQN